jgi:hypothetical protein
VVVSHYRVNLGALSTGYIIPEGLDVAGAEVEMNHVDALAAPAADVLADDFMEILFPKAAPAAPSSPESSWAFKPFKFLLKLGPHGSCNKHNLLETFECCKF